MMTLRGLVVLYKGSETSAGDAVAAGSDVKKFKRKVRNRIQV